jgi:hypothetical protein
MQNLGRAIHLADARPITDEQRSQVESAMELSREEVLDHRDLLLELAPDFQLSRLKVDYDGTLIVHAVRPGYFSVIEYAETVGSRLGRRLLIITDDGSNPRQSTTDL